MKTVTEILRKRLQDEVRSGVSVYSISKATGINQSVLGRFKAEDRKRINSETIDKLAEYFGLQLTPIPKKRRSRTRT